MNTNLQYAKKIVQQLTPTERLRLLADMAISLRRELDMAQLADTLWQPTDPEKVAERQGFYQPMKEE